MASDKLQGKRVAFVVAPEGTEQVELTEPWKAVEAAGGSPELLSTEEGEIQAFNHLDKADTFTVDRTVSEADAVEGRKLTSWPSLQTDLRNAGADWVDEEVVVDEGLVTSRKPDDLEAFCAKAVEELCEGQHAAQARSA